MSHCKCMSREDFIVSLGINAGLLEDRLLVEFIFGLGLFFYCCLKDGKK